MILGKEKKQIIKWGVSMSNEEKKIEIKVKAKKFQKKYKIKYVAALNIITKERFNTTYSNFVINNKR